MSIGLSLAVCRELRQKIELADDIEAVAYMSEPGPDETASASTAGTSTGRPSERSADDDDDDAAAGVDIVPSTEVTPQLTAAGMDGAAASPLSDGVVGERRKCKPKDKVDASQNPPDDEVSEAMISPTMKVTTCET